MIGVVAVVVAAVAGVRRSRAACPFGVRRLLRFDGCPLLASPLSSLDRFGVLVALREFEVVVIIFCNPRITE